LDSNGDRENRRTQEIRDALGAVAAAAPAVFWLYQREGGQWHVRREGDTEDCSFPDRESALKAIQIAAVRCTSYCMFLQDITGQFDRKCFSWFPHQSSRG
jgi:hypothetical protein